MRTVARLRTADVANRIMRLPKRLLRLIGIDEQDVDDVAKRTHENILSLEIFLLYYFLR